ncbi:MAG: rhamnan synthesis F family protein [Deltaproteobacteria bacterium]|nr:rhamnan synthesis F family protein [Deltaproteobacteria bacterium]
MPRRLLLYAHHDASAHVRSASRRVLRSLAPFVERIHITSTSPLGAAEVADLEREFGSVELRENLGFDFSMWQRSMVEDVVVDGVARFDEVLLVNSSIVGPFHPVEPLFRRMDGRDVAFWSLTEGLAPVRHLQSYFLVLRRAVLESAALERFFTSVLPFQNKWGSIAAYELGLTLWLTQNGFVGEAAWPLLPLVHDVWSRGASLLQVRNPMRALASELVDRGFPYVKLDALQGRNSEIASLKERAEHAIHHRRLVANLRRRGIDIDELVQGA